MTELDNMLDALRTADTSVFRLEALQDYPDDPQWQAHQQGLDWTRNDDLAAWCDLVSANVARGVVMRRVHVVTEPWTPYVRFEVEQHYPWNQHAGEDVGLIRWSQQWARPDFWLIDDRAAWLLNYDRDGAMSVVRATERSLPTLQVWRDFALGEAEPLPLPV